MSGEIRTNRIRETIDKLKSDPIRNSSIIGFLKNNPISLILSEGESILVKGKSDREWIYISSKNKIEFQSLAQNLKAGNLCFASLEDWMIQELTLSGKIDWKLTTARYFFPEGVVIPGNKIMLDRLNQKDAAYIMSNSSYRQFFTEEYLKDRIERSFSAAVKLKGRLVAWALTHDDGAIGALHVLDDFRNKGFAQEMICNLSDQIRKAGNIPIAQIEEKNSHAIRLFEKIGFTKDRNTTWLKLFQ